MTCAGPIPTCNLGLDMGVLSWISSSSIIQMQLALVDAIKKYELNSFLFKLCCQTGFVVSTCDCNKKWNTEDLYLHLY